jgi:sialate O-acetylesterase
MRWTNRLLAAFLVVMVCLGGAIRAADAPAVAPPAEPAKLPFLHPLFSDYAVLQRGIQVPVWGWTEPGKVVTVKIAGKSAEATAGADGKWMAKVGPFEAGGPHVLEVTGPENAMAKEVLFGDVWICSGQSNMEMGMVATGAAEDIASADIPNLRLMAVPKAVTATPQQTAKLAWAPSSPDALKKMGNYGGFSAVAFHFGRELHKEVGVPIGVIHTSWGGTIAEAWVSAEALKPLGDFDIRLANVKAEPGKPNVVTVLYNGMIAPLVPYGIKGAIWYQGESNAGKAWQYRRLLPALIADWRNRFGVGEFPFYIVSLAAYQKTHPEPRENNWAELREAQAFTAKTVKNAGLAIAIDIGEANDIHPKNKKDVGLRLARWALAKDYGKPVEFSGPWYKSMVLDGGKVKLSFDHVGGGLVAKGEKLTGFAIAGEDKKFVWADAVIEGDKVAVSSEKVAKPVAVRYAWDINPVCNLYNKAGLPAVPFRTDEWPATTVNAK